MSATLRDFAFERACVEASNDDQAILDWMREYHIDRRDAQASGDDDVVRELDDLLSFAEDRVVEIKDARDVPPEPVAVQMRAEPRQEARRVAIEPAVAQRTTAPPSRDYNRPAERSERRDRDDAAEIAAAKQVAAEQAAAEQAEAEAKRRDDEELRELRERARKAEARVKAAQAETARLKAIQLQAAVEQERERRQRAKDRAAKDAKAQEQAAAEAEAAARAAAQVVAEVAPTSASRPAPTVRVAQDQRPDTGASASRPVAAPVELTPIAQLFQERLAEAVLVAPAPAIAAPKVAGTVTQPGRKAAANRPPVAPTAPAVAPVDDVPQLTGADLTSFRNWLGVSQRALASKLTVEQSVISKSEGKPTTVLPPQLRKALHQAMGEPRPDVRGAL